MNIEVEAKARAADPAALQEYLAGMYGKPETVEKSDVYYIYPNGRTARIREQGGKTIVTVKRKTLSGGGEINEEIEFGIDSKEAFLSFMQETGAGFYYEKSKRGFVFKDGGGLVIELCEVSGLGWFLEIERILPDGSGEDDLRAARAQVVDAFASAGIGEDELEQRFYSEMILGE